ncbi:MAG: 2-phospho-L-lactate transferase [Deltaproteobacteria bacterium RIFCSPLOWO2_12_FULL_60_19]|nr:MAG: 2-phospho-L-lactate transferase [Deltaproteobacteria bacterium RIFCSPLOWO2_12_FULL_60_19]
MLAVLTGGTGGAKLIQGLSLETDPAELVIVCNTGDDFVFHGLHISPDLDTTTYTLAGFADTERGWGIKGDTFATLEWIGKYGGESWFKVGDRDLATHLTRTRLLNEGLTLTQATEKIRKALGVRSGILPMSDDKVETRIRTPAGEISFQEYFVKERWSSEVSGVAYAGVAKSRAVPGVVEAIRKARAVIVCPSNPVTSIGPILAVPGVRQALEETPARVIGVSPIIQGAAVTGPADKLMAAMGMEASSFGVAKAYADFLDTFVIAPEDSSQRNRIEALGVETVATAIRMNSLDDKKRSAREVLALV